MQKKQSVEMRVMRKLPCFYRSTTLFVDEVNQTTFYATDDLWLFFKLINYSEFQIQATNT